MITAKTSKPTGRASKKLLLLMLLGLLGCPTVAVTDAPKLRLWPDNLFGIDFVSPEIGFVSGYAGTLLRTRDGGQSWQWSHAGVDELLRRISFVDENHGWAVGHRGSIVKTSDGGDSWVIQHQQAGVYLRDIEFFDRDHGWVVGHDATILYTHDGGATWAAQHLTGFKGRDLPRLHGIAVLDAGTAVVVGEFGVVAVTEDRGATWNVQKPATNKTLLDIARVGAKAFLAVGLDGTLLQISTAAAGKGRSGQFTVNAIEAGTNEHLFAIASAGHGRALATGRSTVALIDGDTVTGFVPDETIQLPFTWFAGVDIGADERFWLVGIRGAIASGLLSDGRFSSAAVLGLTSNVRPNQQQPEHSP